MRSLLASLWRDLQYLKYRVRDFFRSCGRLRGMTRAKWRKFFYALHHLLWLLEDAEGEVLVNLQCGMKEHLHNRTDQDMCFDACDYELLTVRHIPKSCLQIPDAYHQCCYPIVLPRCPHITPPKPEEAIQALESMIAQIESGHATLLSLGDTYIESRGEDVICALTLFYGYKSEKAANEEEVS